MIKDGRYLAKPKAWGLNETKDGKPYVYVDFDVDGASITWKGYLSDKSKEITAKALVVCGFKYGNIDGVLESDALDSKSDVSITIEAEEYEGKTYSKVKWVNPLRKKLSRDESVKLLKGVDLADIFKSELQAMGTSDDIDF